MANLIKIVEKTPTHEEWTRMMGMKKHSRGDCSSTLSAASKRAKKSQAPQYVFATGRGYIVQDAEPQGAKGNHFYRITVKDETIVGELFEI